MRRLTDRARLQLFMGLLIERGHERDISDVRDLLTSGVVTPEGIRAELDRVEPELYRYPAIDPASFLRAVDEALAPFED